MAALAVVAEAMGWTHERPDYRDLDAGRRPQDLAERVARLQARAQAHTGPLLLAGSSMGAFISAEVAMRLQQGAARASALLGLFLMAPPVTLPGYWPTPLQAPEGLPLMVVHGWDDELIPAQAVTDWCAPRRAELRLVNDSHRLAAHVDYCARSFETLLLRVSA